MKRLTIVLALLGGCATSRPEPIEDLPGPSYGPPAQKTIQAPKEPLNGLTLEKALALSEDHHPALAEARARVEAAGGRVQQAGLYPNPALVARMESAPVSGGTTANAEFVVGTTVPVAIGGRLGAATRVEEREQERLVHELDVRRLEVRARVHASYAAALYGEQVAKLAAETQTLMERAAEVARVRLAAGDALPEEVARAEMELARTRVDRTRADSLRDLSFLGLASAIGDLGLRLATLEGSLEVALEMPTLEAVLAALDRSPYVKSSEAQVAVEQARAELSKAGRIPDVNLDLFYRRINETGTNAFDVGINVPLPLFNRNQGTIRENEANVRAARAGVRSTRNELEVRLREAHARLALALSNARLLKEEILPRSDTILRGAETRYAGGDISLAEILPIRRDRAQGRLSYLETLRDVMDAWSSLKPFLESK